ncbi:hypothetical protein [Aerococcus tenax]|uniref:hypothetical protein n=1 Tax=Aerococcus tenax TaxID=3078812 RepID=UPI0018A6EEE5|nr:hypothetical protein [Aerococcus tenax]
MKNFIIDVIIFAISFIIQSIIGNWINLDNLFIDFLSFVIIFIIIRSLFARAKE